MITPQTPADESPRLTTLRSLNILDTPHEERFDRLTRLAKRLFQVPMALISFVDENRQWFKSCQGLDATETPRDVSFCGHAILGDDILLVEDARLDVRFHDNPLVVGDPKIRFYVGCPLSAPNGAKLGTLCLIDREPRSFTEEDSVALRDLADMAEREIAALQMATTDELTSLSNRRGFLTLGQYALNACTRFDRNAWMLFFDLDGLKPINDKFGHAAGDQILTAFANQLLSTFRSSDIVGRLGGDEFVVLMTNCPTEENHSAINRLQRSIDTYNQEEQREYELRFSVGIVQYDARKHHNLHELIIEADALMYERKKNRRH